MKIRPVGLLASLLLTACAGAGAGMSKSPPAETVDPFELQIRIGRLGVMMDQAVEAFRVASQLPEAESITAVLRRSAAEDREGRSGAASAQEVSLLAQLQLVVRQFERLRVISCDIQPALIVDPDACAGSPTPSWAGETSQAQPTLAQLDTWADETQGEIVPLWGALCVLAVAKTGDAQFCAIE